MNVSKTKTGLEIIRFQDGLDHECIVQTGSGMTGIWISSKGPNGALISRDQLSDLMTHFRTWMVTGHLVKEGW